jgi:beta-glucosidase
MSMGQAKEGPDPADPELEERVGALLRQMTLSEKIGQMCQVNGADGKIPDWLTDAVAGGRLGSVINEVDVATVNELQRIATEESRLGIPLLIGRDVIHGFRTIFPIPLGQAASWNPDLVQRAAEIAAREAVSAGVNWTFAPMLDVTRDPRWGRICESFGEDPFLIGELGCAMIRGFQGNDLAKPGNIAACAKHFAGYGASESGRDYNTTNIPEIELRNAYLPPFEAAMHAGVATVMAGFNDLNGVPCSANAFLLTQVLRDEWQFPGFVVSDWDSVAQLRVHGFAANDKESAEKAFNAGLDMEMTSSTYADHLAQLLDDGKVSERQIDAAVSRILRLKFQLGLFDNHLTDPTAFPASANRDSLDAARLAARQSVVLLSNDSGLLPLSRESLTSVAVIGPLADAPDEQLGAWVFDGDPGICVTPLQAIRDFADGAFDVHVARGVATTRSFTDDGFDAAVAAAAEADVALLFLGEEAILSGEAHCRADITLPGNQAELIDAVAATATPIVLVIMAGRPLALENIVDEIDAILYAWHPGTMAGPAITDLLFGIESPSGKLPVTLPRATGQIPIYYAHKNSGRPGIPDNAINMITIKDHDEPESAGYTSFHLDAGCTPLFRFGHGLSYSEFRYEHISAPVAPLKIGETFDISVELTNVGDVAADEIVQLYVRDLVGSVTRPVKELKGFRRLRLRPGEHRTVSFRVHTDQLAFFGADMQRRVEPGRFRLWIGPDSGAELCVDIELID